MGKICTKRGDDGTTSLLDGTRISKCDVRIEANGEIDELVALMGLARVISPQDNQDSISLQEIQEKLMSLMSHVVSSVESPLQDLEPMIERMEAAIDTKTRRRPFSFVIPGNNRIEALLHVMRAKSRTVERRLWAVHEQFPLADVALRFINRLSDYLYVLAVERS